MQKDEIDELTEKLNQKTNRNKKLNSQLKAETQAHELLKKDMEEMARKSAALVTFHDGIKDSTEKVFHALNMQDADSLASSSEGLNKMEMMFFREIGGKLMQESERLQETQRQGKASGIAKDVMITTQYATLVKDVIKDTVRAWQQKEGKENSKELDLEEFQQVVWNRIFSDLQSMFDVLQTKIQEKAAKMNDLAATPAF